MAIPNMDNWTDEQKADYAAGKSVAIMEIRDGVVISVTLYAERPPWRVTKEDVLLGARE
jgi:hypothetical protein